MRFLFVARFNFVYSGLSTPGMIQLCLDTKAFWRAKSNLIPLFVHQRSSQYTRAGRGYSKSVRRSPYLDLPPQSGHCARLTAQQGRVWFLSSTERFSDSRHPRAGRPHLQGTIGWPPSDTSADPTKEQVPWDDKSPTEFKTKYHAGIC